MPKGSLLSDIEKGQILALKKKNDQTSGFHVELIDQ